MHKPRFLISAIILFIGLSASYSQQINIQANNKALNEILIDVRDRYGLQFSFDDKLLSEYSISINQSFSDVGILLDQILRKTNLNWEKSGDVYLIYPKVMPKEILNLKYLLSGTIYDVKSGESLPYSHLLINGRGMVSDEAGNFAFKSNEDSIFHIKATHLGYYILDTIVRPGVNQKFHLFPSVVKLAEIIITGEVLAKSGQIGDRAGAMRLNHKVSGFIPGSGDNSVFNYLRLQPGILAAGEQSGDLIMWGSYEGHSQILFDGFTIFGLKNYNDNISAVNPYLAKDILIMKAGYDASWGERVGGIVNITGINGNTSKPIVNLTLNNMTMNGMMSVPVFGKSALIAAFRKTYYNLYNPEDINFISRTRNNGTGEADISLYPDYDFHDMNLKYSGELINGDSWQISYYRGKDLFSYQVDQERELFKIKQESEEKNNQTGGSILYNKRWEKGGSTNISFGHSSLIKENTLLLQSIRLLNDRVVFDRDEDLENKLSEFSFKINNHTLLNEHNQIDFGIAYYQHQTTLRIDSSGIVLANNASNADRFNAFIQDNISVTEKLIVRPGLRVDYPVLLSRPYIQPRLQIEFKLNKSWKLTLSAGIYNQFISESAIVDELGNYQYAWTISDNKETPVLSSNHYVTGFVYNENYFSFCIESYYRTTEGIPRFVNRRERGTDIYEGQARSYGLDLYVKRDFNKHSAWISYTLSKTEELFSYFPDKEYRYAPQDQQHELKTAILLNWSPVRFSIDYVYGSGFLDRATAILNQDADRYPYKRVDAAIGYNLSGSKIFFETGLSILNIFNTENIKYSNFTRLPAELSPTVSIHAEAIPFTPTLFLKISF